MLQGITRCPVPLPGAILISGLPWLGACAACASLLRADSLRSAFVVEGCETRADSSCSPSSCRATSREFRLLQVPSANVERGGRDAFVNS